MREFSIERERTSNPSHILQSIKYVQIGKRELNRQGPNGKSHSLDSPTKVTDKSLSLHSLEDISSQSDRLPERLPLKFCIPTYCRKPNRLNFGNTWSTYLDLNWSDFVFNLVNLCLVYMCFSNAAVHGQTIFALLLYFFVAIFDIVLLLLRWAWFDQSSSHGGIIMCACQLYRVVIVLGANTWMSYKALNNMEFQPDVVYIVVLALLIMACIVFGTQVSVSITYF